MSYLEFLLSVTVCDSRTINADIIYIQRSGKF